MGGRPREHQDSIERHELVGPDHAGQSKHEICLHDKAKDQVEIQFVHKVNLGGTLILLQGQPELVIKKVVSLALKFQKRRLAPVELSPKGSQKPHPPGGKGGATSLVLMPQFEGLREFEGYCGFGRENDLFIPGEG